MATDKLLKQALSNQVTKLNLSGKTLTLARVQILVEAISQFDCKLKKLDLSHCSLPEVDKEAILILIAQAVQKNKSLTEVNFTLKTTFSDAVTHALTQALQLNSSITAFHINLKSLSPVALRPITSALQDNQMLHEKATIYTPQFFKLSPSNSRQTSIDHLAINQPLPLRHAA